MPPGGCCGQEASDLSADDASILLLGTPRADAAMTRSTLQSAWDMVSRQGRSGRLEEDIALLVLGEVDGPERQ